MARFVRGEPEQDVVDAGLGVAEQLA